MASTPNDQQNNQILFLREALDRSAVVVKQAEAATAKAQAELQAERTRSFCAQAEVYRLSKIVEISLEENKRLRGLMVELHTRRDAATKSAPPPVPEPEPEPDPFAREPEARSNPIPPPRIVEKEIGEEDVEVSI